MGPFIKALLLALSLAIDVFAVSVGIGIKQADMRARLRFAAAFVGAELSMLLIGSIVGKVIYAFMGPIAGYLGFIALIVIGVFVILETLKSEKEELDLSRGFGLFLSALAVSFDSLGIGFSIWFINVPIVFTAVAIGTCTIAATMLGFLLGRRLGAHFEERAELLAGILLILTGVIFIALKATGHE